MTTEQDDVTFAQCDNDLIEHCVCVINPVYKKLTVAKGKYEVIITGALEGAAAQAGPIGNTCMATGKRGTLDITITAPDNATMNNASYKKYYPNVAKGSYVVQEGAGQALMKVAQARILPATFLSENFTAESKYWDIPGLTKGEFVSELTWLEANFTYTVSGSDNVTITKYTGAGGNVVIP
ncbi:MAG: hypothetical protein NTX06_00920, partial [Proteobacteria bacterium]|nr:hypothetical protein [Pseudomonadota bacterium]